jgi:hypothetical protein
MGFQQEVLRMLWQKNIQAKVQRKQEAVRAELIEAVVGPFDKLRENGF